MQYSSSGLSTLSRLVKYARSLITPAYWPYLARLVVPTSEHGRALSRFAFRTVLDVGANKGQFAAFAFNAWPDAQLYCFEPLPKPRGTLKAIVAAKRVRVFDVALGSQASSMDMHIAQRDDSSSLLPIGEHQTTLHGTHEVGVQPVKVERIDSLLNLSDLLSPCLLKIDVQGFELDVIKGATGLLSAIDVIYAEMSYIELYKGQPLYSDIIAFLHDYGFAVAGVYNQSDDTGLGAIQADVLLQRRTSPLAAATLKADQGVSTPFATAASA